MSSYAISELYEFAPDLGLTDFSRPNPLALQGALNEAELIDMRLSPQRSRVGVIFDIRWCNYEKSNTALVVLTGVGKVAWSNDAGRQRPWYSTRGYWAPSASELSVAATPDGEAMWANDVSDSGAPAHLKTIPIRTLSEYVLNFDWLSVSGLSARIYIGHIDGLGDAPPDMTELSDAEIIRGFPQWSSIMEVREHYSHSP